MTKLAQSIYRFLSLPTPVWNKVFLEFWVKLDVFIVLTESFIESYVNQTCKHTEFFWNMMFCNIPQAGCCYLLFSTFSLLSRVFNCLCRKLQINVFVPAQTKMPTFVKVFFFFFLAGVVWNDGKTSPNHLLHMVARKEKLKLWRWN